MQVRDAFLVKNKRRPLVLFDRILTVTEHVTTQYLWAFDFSVGLSRILWTVLRISLVGRTKGLMVQSPRSFIASNTSTT
jgi:hypothetical protein